MAGTVDDEALSRWLDGALDGARAAEVAAQLEADPALAARARGLDARDAALRGWFDDQAPPPAGLEQTVRAAFAARRARRAAPVPRHWWLPAAAAAAVVAVGLASFDYLIERRVDAAMDRMRAERASDLTLLASAVQEVLETHESGARVSFHNAATGLSVTLTPKRTWKSASGHWCREFIEVFDGAPAETAPVGTACRGKDGLWTRVATQIPGVQPAFPPHRQQNL